MLVHETPTYGASTDLFELAFHLVETEDILGIHWDVQLHTMEGLLRRVLIAAPVFLKGRLRAAGMFFHALMLGHGESAFGLAHFVWRAVGNDDELTDFDLRLVLDDAPPSRNNLQVGISVWESRVVGSTVYPETGLTLADLYVRYLCNFNHIHYSFFGCALSCGTK